MIYEYFIRPLLFWLSKDDPEKAHELVLALLRDLRWWGPLRAGLRKVIGIQNPRLEQTLFGLRFPNPIGLAAGFDKNGIALQGLAALGFGFIEMGTVTRYTQPGNPRPRIFRLPRDQALINRMGFNNDGADKVAAALASMPKLPVPLGISIGKSKVTPLEEAVWDYLYTLQTLYPYGDYFVVNVSSPNTPGLRQLQEKKELDILLEVLIGATTTWGAKIGQPPKPLLVKIAPDLTETALDELLEVCVARRVDGLICTNTTIGRKGLRTQTTQEGGLSGWPLYPAALATVVYVRMQLPDMPIIGVGGISSPEDVYTMFTAGVNLFQIYTALVYQGPGIVRHLNRELLRYWREDDSISPILERRSDQCGKSDW